MRRNVSMLMAAGVAVLLAGATLTSAAGATLRPCLVGHKVKVVNGKATMLLKGQRVKCRVVKKVTPTPSPTATAFNPPLGVEVRMAGEAMNSLTARAGMTITLRNADAVPRTFVIASEGISELVPPVSDGVPGMSAFFAPKKAGTYVMSTSENPLITAKLVVIP